MNTQALICKPHKQLKEETMNEGREAFKEACHGNLKDNPYAESSTFHKWWDQGWTYELFQSGGRAK